MDRETFGFVELLLRDSLGLLGLLKNSLAFTDLTFEDDLGLVPEVEGRFPIVVSEGSLVELMSNCTLKVARARLLIATLPSLDLVGRHSLTKTVNLKFDFKPIYS